MYFVGRDMDAICPYQYMVLVALYALHMFNPEQSKPNFLPSSLIFLHNADIAV